MGSGSLGSAASRVTESIDMDEMPVKPIETKKAAKIARSKKLDIALANDSIVAGSIKKLLLLGAGGSGKSTIFKQMKVIYGLNYSEAEKKRIAPVIYRYFPFIVPTTHFIKECKPNEMHKLERIPNERLKVVIEAVPSIVGMSIRVSSLVFLHVYSTVTSILSTFLYSYEPTLSALDNITHAASISRIYHFPNCDTSLHTELLSLSFITSNLCLDVFTFFFLHVIFLFQLVFCNL
jgi:hypothetical protein